MQNADERRVDVRLRDVVPQNGPIKNTMDKKENKRMGLRS